MKGKYGLKEQFTEPTMYDILFSEWPDTTNGSQDPYTGQIRLEVDGGWDDELQIKHFAGEAAGQNSVRLAQVFQVYLKSLFRQQVSGDDIAAERVEYQYVELLRPTLQLTLQ